MPVWESELRAQTRLTPYNESAVGTANPPTTVPGDVIVASFTPEGGFAYIEGIELNLTNNNAALVNVAIYAVSKSGARQLVNTVALNPGSTFNDWLRWMYDALAPLDEITSIEIVASFSDPNGGLDYSIRVTGLTSLPSVSPFGTAGGGTVTR